MLGEQLRDSLGVLRTDPSPAAQVRACATYHHINEGMLTLSGCHAWQKVCIECGVLPGMQNLVRHISDDKRRHVAWGTFTCRRHVAADDSTWVVLEKRMSQLIPLASRVIEALVASHGDQFPSSPDGFVQRATESTLRRLAAISRARGDLAAEIEADTLPLALEETLAGEDKQALTGSETPPRRSPNANLRIVR
jgi:ribonucleoside-diphosphate reductase beta chain